ncbi:MAG: ribulokinase [Planctomycetes bacterium]|nr:ribulokinase [Planctomycetota bacterium]
MAGKVTIGIDFGTNSVRALVVDVATGEERGTCVANYASGDQGVIGDPGNPHVARQHPRDWLEGLEESVRGALADARGVSPDDVIGIGVDTTGSTPLPVDAKGTPLVFREEFEDRIDALAWLWKDHSGMEEAETITALARRHRPQYLAKCGGIYSSEWFFSKILHCLRVAPDVFDAAFSWVEFVDYIPAVLAGIEDPRRIKPSVCAAGHKAMYCMEWGGLPDPEFLGMLDPKLASLRERLYDKAYPADVKAGELCAVWAEKLGLRQGIPIAVGAFDAHLGGVGAGVGEGVLAKIIGTSTCDILVAAKTRQVPDIPGVCGIVDGSVLPNYYGIEAGQSAVGDIFNWFIRRVCQGEGSLHEELTAEAKALAPGRSGLLALDWNNGNRTILVDARLTGLLLGQTLRTSRAEIYRALIEATAFGALTILNRLEEYGVKIERIVNCGGIAEKNAMLMQIYADVTGRPMAISRSAQTCALGSAIFGAVVAGPKNGGYRRAEEAQAKMTGVKDVIYRPIPENQAVYKELYALYRSLHDSFGVKGHTEDLSGVMKKLLEIKSRVS